MSSFPQPSRSALEFSAPYYANLFSSQYWTSTNLIQWFGANIQLYQDILNCANNFDAALDLGQAIGAQLDVLGSILGQPRTVTFQPSDSVSPILDDTTYRLLLQATVLRNHWNGLLVSLRTIWNTLFPSGILLVTDNQNMSLNLYVATSFTSIIQDLISNDLILPRAQGVQYIYSFAAIPLLGYDENTAYIAGFGTLAATTTGTLTNGSPTVTVASAAGIINGQIIVGVGIPGDTTITISGTTVTMSNNATAGGTGVALSFYTSDDSGHFA